MTEKNENLASFDEVDMAITPTEVLSPEEEIIRFQNQEIEEVEEVEEENQLSDEALSKLIQFTTGKKDLSVEELDSIRNDDKELERMIRISIAKSKHITFKPNKPFSNEYRKKRKSKNKQTRKSRALNRK